MNESTVGDRAFTIMELMVSLTILGLVTFLALPNFQELWGSHIRGNAIRELQSDLRRMRAEALAAGTRAVLELDIDGEGYAFGLDELPYSSPPTMDRAIFRRNLPGGIVLSHNQDLLFDSKGVVIDATGAVSSVNFSLDFRGNNYANLTAYSTGAFTLN